MDPGHGDLPRQRGRERQRHPRRQRPVSAGGADRHLRHAQGPGFGAAYEANHTGEWEYVAFRPDRTYQTAAPNSAPCAACHTDAGGTRDWVYRANLFFEHASGAVPTAPAGLAAAGRIPIQQYAFLPSEVAIRPGTTITWSNEDEAVHTVTAADKSWDSGRLPVGGTFSHTFAEPGTCAFACTIHPAMQGTLTVA